MVLLIHGVINQGVWKYGPWVGIYLKILITEFEKIHYQRKNWDCACLVNHIGQIL